MQRRQYIYRYSRGLYGEKWGRMCARSFVLGRLSGEGRASQVLRLVSFGVFMSLSYSVFCSLLCRACEVHSEGVSTHYLRALERTRYDRTNHLT